MLTLVIADLDTVDLNVLDSPAMVNHPLMLVHAMETEHAST